MDNTNSQTKKQTTGKRRWRKGRLILTALIICVVVFVLVNLVSFINYLGLDMARVSYGSVDNSFECQAVVIRSESVIYAPVAGEFISEVAEGQKVKVGGKLGYMADETGASLQSVSTAMGGLVFYNLDGWEEVLTPETMLSVDWRNVFSQFAADTDTAEADSAPEELENLGSGRKIARVVDNIAPIYVCLAVDGDLTPYLNGESVGLWFEGMEEGRAIKAYLNDPESFSANDRYILVKVSEESDLLNNLRYGTVKVIGNSATGIKIPLSAITQNEEGQTGVFVEERKQLAFREVTILCEDNENAVVEGLESTDVVASNPSSAKVGQKVY